VADMVPDNPGAWLFHCHVLDHLVAGMSAHYTVLPKEGGAIATETRG
jgi:FtsP/CotA-like multicopper oxidase with cupredoxin domain